MFLFVDSMRMCSRLLHVEQLSERPASLASEVSPPPLLSGLALSAATAFARFVLVF
eukprot:m.124651 g.124651  ORF g.124651 m.124651 type:complete len:56 (-) comp15597_c1_seq3:757-924(-)